MAQSEVGSSSWKSTARRVVSSAPSAALQNPKDRVPFTPDRTHNRIKSPRFRSWMQEAGTGKTPHNKPKAAPAGFPTDPTEASTAAGPSNQPPQGNLEPGWVNRGFNEIYHFPIDPFLEEPLFFVRVEQLYGRELE
ncbi:hypothetical protein Vadar_022461 [Vaccinium darrowii]|uniref:Uncharacterized protein n=1 Tax=Vaccinium darrowii TaxID=229202 RepID=A0ACB7Y125_9ERIC|nr:hypothetical protein Vadar_022461 [Vaccinium darrowii]